MRMVRSPITCVPALALILLGAPFAEAGGRPIHPRTLSIRGGASDEGGSGSGGNFDPAASSMEDMLKAAGVDSSKLDELLQSVPGGAEGLPSMEESVGMMQEMINSPMFQQYMNDPEQLEKSRQMILQNPVMKSMMDGMPGMEEILNDEEKWRDTMRAAADMYKEMGTNLMNIMGSQAGAAGMGGIPGLDSLGGIGSSTAALEALDELSEGED